MSKSPISITEIFYPVMAFRAVPGGDVNSFSETMPVRITAAVRYGGDGSHLARLTIEQPDVAPNRPYTIELEAFAAFSFDKAKAKIFYGERIISSLSVNVVSILFSSAREAIANFTARGPFSSVYIDGEVFDSQSVDVGFDADPQLLFPDLFDLPAPDDAVVTKMEAAAKKGLKRAPIKRSAPKRKPRK